MRVRNKLISGKIIFDRIKNYIAIVNFGMIMALLALDTSYSIWIVAPLAIAIAVTFGLFDYKFILPREFDKITALNPYMRTIKKDLDEIKEMLKHDNAA